MTDYRGVYLLWRGELAEIISDTTARFLGIRMIEPKHCPHCNGYLEQEVFDVIPTSPLFRDSAKPIKTLAQPPTSGEQE